MGKILTKDPINYKKGSIHQETIVQFKINLVYISYSIHSCFSINKSIFEKKRELKSIQEIVDLEG